MQMSDGLSHRHALPLAVATTALAVVTAAFLFGRRRPQSSARRENERETLVAVLADLSLQFFDICREVALIATHVRSQKKALEVPKERLNEELIKKCKVYEKLEQLQHEVPAKHGLSPEEVTDIQSRYSDDPVVAAYTEGFKAMLDDALEAQLPILPNQSIPAALTKEKVLAMQKHVYDAEIKFVVDKVGGKLCPVDEVYIILGQAGEESQKACFDSCREEFLEGGGDVVYQSALASYMRDPGFAVKKKKLDEVRQKKLSKLFKPLQAAGAASRVAPGGGGAAQPDKS